MTKAKTERGVDNGYKNTPKENQDALVTFFNIMKLWGVDKKAVVGRAILGSPPSSTYAAWKNGRVGKLPMDTVFRISHVFGIFKDLQILFSDTKAADSWVLKPNEQFGGQSAIERMAAGQPTDLAEVHYYLDAMRDGYHV